ncbi:MAG: RIP metalloprotease RseP [Cellvibrionales bacterium TMED148]|nr:RIP metalloprotease RseP [Porticoccaceae bacterium]RPG89638.1 MAG: RIP metalloprotease RseP [Cellvibrionales bacterium TMED148]
MHILETILYTFLTLGIAIVIHEYGHFIVARKCGVFVERFSLGFGSPLIGWTDRHGTNFVISALPLGGYVKMLDSRSGHVPEDLLGSEFGRQNVWKRIAITIAGPFANLLLSIFAFWVLFFNGETGVKPIVGNIEDESPAKVAGFAPGMTILSVNEQLTPNWSNVSKELFSSIGTTGSLKFVVKSPESGDTIKLSIPIEKWLRDASEPYPIYELGLTPKYTFKQLNLGLIMEGSAAEKAGLLSGDVVTKINGWNVNSTQIFVEEIESNANRTVVLDIVRDNVDMRIEVTPEAVFRDGFDYGQIGVQLAPQGIYPESMLYSIEHTISSAAIRSLSETSDYITFIIKSIKKLLTGELSSKSLSGPIGIAKAAGDSGRAGLDNFIRFTAILSIMLGVMNMLPIPVLDGGHLIFYVIEIIKGSPVSEEMQVVGLKLGVAILFGFMMVATFNDLTRAFM